MPGTWRFLFYRGRKVGGPTPFSVPPPLRSRTYRVSFFSPFDSGLCLLMGVGGSRNSGLFFLLTIVFGFLSIFSRGLMYSISPRETPSWYFGQHPIEWGLREGEPAGVCLQNRGGPGRPSPLALSRLWRLSTVSRAGLGGGGTPLSGGAVREHRIRPRGAPFCFRNVIPRIVFQWVGLWRGRCHRRGTLQ